jgi:hypothetical protein
MTSSIVVGQKSHKTPNPNSTLGATDANPPPGTTAAPHREPPPLALFGEIHDSTTQTTPQLDDTDLDTAVRGHVSRYARSVDLSPYRLSIFLPRYRNSHASYWAGDGYMEVSVAQINPFDTKQQKLERGSLNGGCKGIYVTRGSSEQQQRIWYKATEAGAWIPGWGA